MIGLLLDAGDFRHPLVPFFTKRLTFFLDLHALLATCPRALWPAQILCIICQKGSSRGSSGNGTIVTWTFPAGKFTFSGSSRVPSAFTVPSNEITGVLIADPFSKSKLMTRRPSSVGVLG